MSFTGLALDPVRPRIGHLNLHAKLAAVVVAAGRAICADQGSLFKV